MPNNPPNQPKKHIQQNKTANIQRAYMISQGSKTRLSSRKL
uniref:Uncharacterized protein n=1 Tax=Rhizophora mucronata TaxID=61149 RepID=A0A2P2QK09_RHIMU